MKLIEEYKGWKIWHGEQYSYTGYFVSMPGHEYDAIRSGNTISGSRKMISNLLKV